MTASSPAAPDPPGATYDVATHTWSPACPYGDMCVRCDAIRECVRRPRPDHLLPPAAPDARTETIRGFLDDSDNSMKHLGYAALDSLDTELTHLRGIVDEYRNVLRTHSEEWIQNKTELAQARQALEEIADSPIGTPGLCLIARAVLAGEDTT